MATYNNSIDDGNSFPTSNGAGLAVQPTSVADDYPADTTTTGVVTLGGSAAGNIETIGDVDWFKVSLVAGHSYQIDLEGSPTGQGTLTDTYLRGIYDSTGTFIPGTTDDDGGVGYNSQLIFTPTVSGNYFIAAGAFNTWGTTPWSNSVGTYHVWVPLAGGEGNDTLNGTAGDDHIYGNGGDDTLTGGAGNDLLNGGLGNDSLNGGSGNDSLDGGDGNDTYLIAKTDGVDTLTDSGGTDVVKFTDMPATDISVSRIGYSDLVLNYGGSHLTVQDYFTSTDTRIEQFQFSDGTVWGWADIKAHLSLTGTGSNDILYGYDDSNDSLSGLAGNDWLFGYGGNDTLDGGTGNDTMYGGDGNDSYWVDSALDSVFEYAYQGTDTVYSSVNFNLFAWGTVDVENLTLLTGALSATGNGLDNILTGNVAANSLAGLTGNDTLNGNDGNDSLMGGDGNDSLNGGNGFDIAQYWTATAGVTVNLNLTTAQDTIGAGTDTLTNIEGLNGSNYNDTLTGNAANNSLLGGAGNDTLTGNDGNDSLMGGLGNDSLNGGNGFDIAHYYTATAGVAVNLNLTTAQDTIGAGTDTLTDIEGLNGSAFNDTLTGNAAANNLLGGAGNDTLYGNDGNDSLMGGAGNDSLNGGNGFDLAHYYTASAGVTVNLNLTTAQNTIGAGIDTLTNIEAVNGSAYNDTLTGNAANNTLWGGAGNDVLDGGLGNDVLKGGLGQDSFVFSTALGLSNLDTVTDFTVADDTIQLAQSIFTALSVGVLAADQFKILGNGGVKDSNDHILYNTATGGLSYDTDGSGAAAAVQIAILGKGLALASADFMVA